MWWAEPCKDDNLVNMIFGRAGAMWTILIFSLSAMYKDVVCKDGNYAHKPLKLIQKTFLNSRVPLELVRTSYMLLVYSLVLFEVENFHQTDCFESTKFFIRRIIPTVRRETISGYKPTSTSLPVHACSPLALLQFQRLFYNIIPSSIKAPVIKTQVLLTESLSQIWN